MYASQAGYVGIDICDDFLNPVRDDMQVERNVSRTIQEAGDKTWVGSIDARPQEWLGYQNIPPGPAYLAGVNQWLVSVIACTGV